MRIEDIDQNMKIETDVTEPDIVWFDAKRSPFLLHGISYDEKLGRYVRMPQEVAATVNSGVKILSTFTAGGRLRFKTNSKFIAIHAIQENHNLMNHFTLLALSGFDLYRKNEAGFEIYYHSFRPPMGMKEGYTSPLHTDGAFTEYTLNFPIYDNVKELYIALKKDAIIEEASPYKIEKPIVYYGSSITQGCCASRPGNSYQAMLSRRLNVEHINLGFSGSAKAEAPMVEYLASLCKNASAFVCDYDHNAPNPEYLEQTHLPLYRAVREANPDLPILLISAPDVSLKPAAWLPRLEIVRKTYLIAKSEGDEKIWFLPGNKLFEGIGWDSCTVDGCHPNDLGFFRMANAIEPYLREMLNLQ